MTKNINIKTKSQITNILKKYPPKEALPYLNTIPTIFNPVFTIDTELINENNTFLIAAISHIYKIINVEGCFPYCVLETLDTNCKFSREVANYFFEHLDVNYSDFVFAWVVNDAIAKFEDEAYIEDKIKCGNDKEKNINYENVDLINKNNDLDLIKHNCEKNIALIEEKEKNSDEKDTKRLKTEDTLDYLSLKNINDISAEELYNFDKNLSILFRSSSENKLEKIHAVQRKIEILIILMRKNYVKDIKIMNKLFYLEYDILKLKDKASLLIKTFLNELKNLKKINKYFFCCLVEYKDALRYCNIVNKKCIEYEVDFNWKKLFKIVREMNYKELNYIDYKIVPFEIFFESLLKDEHRKKYKMLSAAIINNESNLEKLNKYLKKIESLEKKDMTTEFVVKIMMKRIKKLE